VAKSTGRAEVTARNVGADILTGKVLHIARLAARRPRKPTPSGPVAVVPAATGNCSDLGAIQAPRRRIHFDMPGRCDGFGSDGGTQERR
jgi:hypothetical protein